jgi:hypothetical protein
MYDAAPPFHPVDMALSQSVIGVFGQKTVTIGTPPIFSGVLQSGCCSSRRSGAAPARRSEIPRCISTAAGASADDRIPHRCLDQLPSSRARAGDERGLQSDAFSQHCYCLGSRAPILLSVAKRGRYERLTIQMEQIEEKASMPYSREYIVRNDIMIAWLAGSDATAWATAGYLRVQSSPVRVNSRTLPFRRRANLALAADVTKKRGSRQGQRRIMPRRVAQRPSSCNMTSASQPQGVSS